MSLKIQSIFFYTYLRFISFVIDCLLISVSEELYYVVIDINLLLSFFFFFSSLLPLLPYVLDDDVRMKTGDLFQLMNVVSTHRGKRKGRILVIFPKSLV